MAKPSTESPNAQLYKNTFDLLFYAKMGENYEVFFLLNPLTPGVVEFTVHKDHKPDYEYDMLEKKFYTNLDIGFAAKAVGKCKECNPPMCPMFTSASLHKKK